MGCFGSIESRWCTSRNKCKRRRKRRVSPPICFYGLSERKRGSFSEGFHKSYIANESTTGYSGRFYGDIIPEGTGGGEEAPPDYRFDAYAKGGVDSFTVTPDEALVPVTASSTETETFTSTTNAKWKWNQTMPGSFSANETSGNNDIHDAYCTHAGSYTVQADKQDDDKVTELTTYTPVYGRGLSAPDYPLSLKSMVPRVVSVCLILT